MADNLNPIVGKSKVFEQQRQQEEEYRRKRRLEEKRRRRKIQQIKAYTVLCFLITIIIIGVIFIFKLISSDDNTQTGQNEENIQSVEQQKEDIVEASASELISKAVDRSTIVLEESDYCYNAEAEILDIIKEKSYTDENIKFIYDNYKAYPNQALRAVAYYDELTTYVLKYPVEVKKDHQSVTSINTSANERKVPLLIQWDDRWGYYKYGEDVIGLSGCGPTCLSMVLMGLSGNTNYTPTYIGDFSMMYGYYINGSGTAWKLFTEGVEKLGYVSSNIEKKEEVLKQKLDEGNYLILSMSKGIFTAGGHFIVIYGYDENGKFMVNDPNSVARSNETYSYAEISDQIKSVWAIGNK